MDDELRQAVAARAHALWQEAGLPEGRELEFWLQAEQELTTLSVAGEEDPDVGLDQIGQGALAPGQPAAGAARDPSQSA
jgi:hypothetical protein